MRNAVQHLLHVHLPFHNILQGKFLGHRTAQMAHLPKIQQGEFFFMVSAICVNLCQHRLQPVILHHNRAAHGKSGNLLHLILIQPHGAGHRLAVRLLRQTHDDLGIRILDRGNIYGRRRLIHNNKALAVGTHLRNVIADHFH